jgi:hypothetical protein
MVMVIVVVVMMMVMVHRFSGLRRSPGRSASDCGLRESVSAEAEREHRGGGEGLDHGKVFLRFTGNPSGSSRALGLAA